MANGSRPLRYFAEHRTATWLELFFDLIFVVVVSKVTHLLAHTHHGHLEPDLWWKFPLMLLPVWWIWMLHTLWSNLYDSDSQSHRAASLFVMLQMIVLSTVMVTDWQQAYQLFNISYFGLRITFALLYFTQSKAHPGHDCFGRHRGIGMAIAALISLSSIFFDEPVRYTVFYLGLGIDLLHPWLMRQRRKLPPLHNHHLIERMGLLIIIMMGESVISLSAGLADIHWDRSSIIAALSGAVMIGTAWWIYFDSYHRLAVDNGRLKDGMLLTYPHFFTCLGLSIMANAIYHAIHPGLALGEYRVMAMVGMLVFYAGKQIPYYAKFPFVRINILVNSSLTFLICGGALLFNSSAAILAGLTCALLFYTVINFLTTIRKMHRLFPEG